MIDTVLRMSIQASVLILAVIALRLILLNILPKRTFPVLWGISVLKLLVPFSVNSGISIFILLEKFRSAASPEFTEIIPASNFPQLSQTSTEISGHGSILSPLFTIWLLGLIVCSLFFFYTHFKCRRIYNESVPVDNEYLASWHQDHRSLRNIEIRQSDRICTPLTYGIMAPVILLPKSMDFSDSKTLGYVLCHEYSHIKNFDILLKLFLAASLCVHWFNPFVWLMYYFSSRDIELACDESVICKLGTETRSGYAMALILLEEQKADIPAIYSSFSRSPIEERIGAIMKSKKLTATAFALSAILIIGTTTVFATSKEDTSTAYNSGPYQSNEQDNKELLDSYKKFGISYDTKGNMYFKGEAIRYFWDGYELDENTMTRYSFYNDSGTVDVHTVRDIKDNGDGSIDPFGELTDILSYSKAEFDARDIDARNIESIENSSIETSVNSKDNISYSNIDNSTGKVIEATSVEDGSSTSSGGRTFEQIFSDYESYGITYKSTSSGLGNVYLNGEIVKAFIDEKDGGVFSFHSNDGGGLIVRTVYDESGNLISLKNE